VVIVQADQARALRNEKIFAGRRVKDVLRDLGGDLAWKIGADTGIGTETGFEDPVDESRSRRLNLIGGGAHPWSMDLVSVTASGILLAGFACALVAQCLH
jgi:hypothetical protein